MNEFENNVNEVPAEEIVNLDDLEELPGEIGVTLEETQKPGARKAVNHVFLWLLLYNLMVPIFAAIVSALGGDLGLSSFVPALAATGLVYLCTLKKWPVKVFKAERKMTWKKFLEFFCVLCACQVLSGLAMYAVNSAGVEGTSIDINTNTLTMILYVGFFGPFCEEMMYRGFAAGKLKSCGKVFAMILSGLAFGLMHMNAAQFVVGFISGLLFGYIFVEYSIVWTLILHIINNFGLAVLPGLLFPNAAAENVDMYTNIVVIVFAVYGLYVIIKNFRGIISYVRDPANRAEPGARRDALKSVWFWIFAAIYVGFIVFFMLNPEVLTMFSAAGAAAG